MQKSSETPILNQSGQNGTVVRLMFEINVSACHLRGCGFDSWSDPFLM
jgi:hypothetical protein